VDPKVRNRIIQMMSSEDPEMWNLALSLRNKVRTFYDYLIICDGVRKNIGHFKWQRALIMQKFVHHVNKKTIKSGRDKYLKEKQNASKQYHRLSCEASKVK
jgi:hypothetical protein